MFAFTLLGHGLINHYGVRLVALLNNTSVIVHIAGVAAIVGLVFWLAPLQPVKFLASAANFNGRRPYAWAFLLGLLQAHWTYTGFDGSAHMAEETRDPRRTAPWGMVIAVAVSGVVGYVLLIALTLAIRSIPRGARRQGRAGQSGTGGHRDPANRASARNTAMPWRRFASMAMWFCGLSCVTSASRAVYSLARDRGMPFAGLMQRVNKKHGTPAAAIWAVVVASLAAMAWTGAVPIVTSLSTVALYLAYVIPVGARIARPLARVQLAGVGRMDARPLGSAGQFHRAVLHRVHLFRTHHAAESTGGENTRRSVGRARLDLCIRSAATNIRVPEWAREQAAHNSAAGA